jgi:hypothetical protein
VGDAPYYRRFGFSASKVKRLRLPGPVDRARFQGLELEKGALLGASGLVVPCGRLVVAERAGSSGSTRASTPIPHHFSSGD